MKALPAFGRVSTGGLKLILSGPDGSGSRPMHDGITQGPGGWNRVLFRSGTYCSHRDLERGGLRFRSEMEAAPGGKAIQIEDPDGNPIELFEPVAR